MWNSPGSKCLYYNWERHYFPFQVVPTSCIPMSGSDQIGVSNWLVSQGSYGWLWDRVRDNMFIVPNPVVYMVYISSSSSFSGVFKFVILWLRIKFSTATFVPSDINHSSYCHHPTTNLSPSWICHFYQQSLFTLTQFRSFENFTLTLIFKDCIEMTKLKVDDLRQ